MIAFNEQLKENAIKQTEKEINQLTNHVFAIQNKIENLQAAQQQCHTSVSKIFSKQLADEQMQLLLHVNELDAILNEELNATYCANERSGT